MSKKAIERAERAYPSVNGSGWFGASCFKREVFIEGYEQAEKDLELTWQDIKRIVNIADDMIDLDVRDELPERCKTEQGYYEEILKRYKEKKEK